MTPREKAIELVNKYFLSDIDIDWYDSIDCALIAVDEILNMNLCLPIVLTIQDEQDIENSIKLLSEYWKEVRKEIQRL